MPAVTVENPLTLPRLPQPLDAVREREVLTITTAPSGFEGEGFPVRRAFADINYRHLDPFIMMDQMGEVDYQPGSRKAPPGTPTGASRPSPTSSTASSTTRTARAAAAPSPTATPSG